MLLKLLLFRLAPLGLLLVFKERKQMKLAVGMLLTLYGVCFFVAAWKIIIQEKSMGILLLPLSMFPQYIFYLFSIWMIVRCIWHSWSERVWKRIYFLSTFSVILGILTEKYVNSNILQLFFEIFK